jgi:HSP20 family molecular chaperone IbpA
MELSPEAVMTEIDLYRFSTQKNEPGRMIIQIESKMEKWTSQVHIWQPPTDLFETANSFVVRVEIAGMQDSEIIVSLEERTLVVRGERALPNRGNAFYQMEISTGEFITAVDLPGPVVVEEITATYLDGFLTVTLPKAEPEGTDLSG